MTLVSDGEEALGRLEEFTFDLVPMDMRMPVLGGEEATRIWRERELPTGRRVPIVALTANAMLDDRRSCLEAGMDGFLPKPIEKQALIHAIQRWTGLVSREVTEAPAQWGGA